MSRGQDITSMWHVVSGSQCTLEDVQWMGKKNNTFMRIVPWCLVNRCLLKYSISETLQNNQEAREALENLHNSLRLSLPSSRFARMGMMSISQGLDSLFVAGKVSVFGWSRFDAICEERISWAKGDCIDELGNFKDRRFICPTSDPKGDAMIRYDISRGVFGRWLMCGSRAEGVIKEVEMLCSQLENNTTGEVSVDQVRALERLRSLPIEPVARDRLYGVLTGLDRSSLGVEPLGCQNRVGVDGESVAEEQSTVTFPGWQKLQALWARLFSKPSSDIGELSQKALPEKARELRKQLVEEDGRLHEFLQQVKESFSSKEGNQRVLNEISPWIFQNRDILQEIFARPKQGEGAGEEKAALCQTALKMINEIVRSSEDEAVWVNRGRVTWLNDRDDRRSPTHSRSVWGGGYDSSSGRVREECKDPSVSGSGHRPGVSRVMGVHTHRGGEDIYE